MAVLLCSEKMRRHLLPARSERLNCADKEGMSATQYGTQRRPEHLTTIRC